MPIYEYYCPNNNCFYSFFAKSSSLRNKIPRCPDDPEFKMEKALSSFSVTGISKKNENTGIGNTESLDDPKMLAAMAELDKEMACMDGENPDPKSMGRLMRKMSDISGQKMPPEMEEMMSRLEAGADPDSLEEEYGDILDDESLIGNNNEELNISDKEIAIKSALRAHQKKEPRRDPNLYDFEDYI